MRLMLLSEEKISATGLGRIGHFSGMGVLQYLGLYPVQLDGSGITFINRAEPFPSVLQTNSGRL
jgi:hypothetical protein